MIYLLMLIENEFIKIKDFLLYGHLISKFDNYFKSYTDLKVNF